MSRRIDPTDLVAEHGTTFAARAGITLRDKPAPLWQLLVLTMLSSARISAEIAAQTAQEVFSAGWRTPQRLRQSTWQQRVDVLGRGGYRRYDESTADFLDEAATRLVDELGGDLRRIRGERTTAEDVMAAVQDSRGSGRRARASSAARSRRSGPRSGPSSTTGPSRQPASSATRTSRRRSPPSCPRRPRCWPRHSCGGRSPPDPRPGGRTRVSTVIGPGRREVGQSSSSTGSARTERSTPWPGEKLSVHLTAALLGTA